MAPTRVSLKTFLSTAKAALSAPPAQRPNPLTFVVGNESADLDSLCSALLLAYFRSQTPPHTLHIPLSNLARADLALRPELNAVLRPAGLKPDDLLTLSDLPKGDGLALRPENTRWLLVDHNALTGPLADQLFSSAVVGCVDHHDDEGKVPPRSGNGEPPRTIEKSGSCMSLVVDHCKDSDIWTAPDTRDLAHVALGPILIDTVNLTSKDKTTDWDVRAAQFVEDKLLSGHHEDNDYDRTAYFDHITRLKEDISDMSYRDILRKDYKRWGGESDSDSDERLALGISSVVQGFDFLLDRIGPKEEMLKALRSWAREQALDIAAVMTTSRPGDVFTRELLVWALNEDAAKLARQFASKNESSLGLERWGEGKLDDDGEGERGSGECAGRSGRLSTAGNRWRLC
ncbi:hypothetical protein B0T17DRAFT_504450 [Bombardia bombarda]|uniref:DHHA2 domain-containing protein n=1 Tax=Bombardia bombarda TaxID=252184 RepID=A0AA40CFN7_9PEZI|nr:hypothetical protein B0T17DRAFT_504450 [Bombardia bombarda]